MGRGPIDVSRRDRENVEKGEGGVFNRVGDVENVGGVSRLHSLLF